MIVLDTSAALARSLPSQASAGGEAFFGSVSAVLIAPAIFAFELRNALLRAERRGLADRTIVEQSSLEFSSIVECRPWNARPAALARLLDLARRERLSLFDAAYLDLAMRESAALASRDTALIEAAQRLSVVVHDLR